MNVIEFVCSEEPIVLPLPRKYRVAQNKPVTTDFCDELYAKHILVAYSDVVSAHIVNSLSLFTQKYVGIGLLEMC